MRPCVFADSRACAGARAARSRLTTQRLAPLPSINKWSPLQREKIAYAAGLIIAQGFSSLELFQNLTKEHLLKDCASLWPPACAPAAWPPD